MSRALRRAGAAAALLAGFGAALAASLASPFNLADEPWFLQVVRRVASGEVLYRDVAFGVTPLSVQIAVPLARLFGVEAWILRALAALCFVLTLALATRIVRRLGAGSGALLGLLLVPFAVIGAWPPYAPLATLFLLASFDAGLSGDARIATWLTGALAGLSFAAKQNVGLLALAAALATAALATTDLPQRAGRAARVLAGFLLAAGASLLPVLLSGAFPSFVDFGFLGKRAYVELGRISYAEGLSGLASFLRRPSAEPRALGGAFEASMYLAAPLALVALAAAFRLAPRRRATTLRVAAFSGAGFLGVYPRADVPHLCYAIPPVLVALAFGWEVSRERVGPSVRRAVVAGAAAWAIAGVALRFGPLVASMRSGEVRASTLPHFRGVLIHPEVEKEIRREAADLSAWAAKPGGAPPLFLLSRDAGLYYLVTGLPNPTRFDYPWVTTFGRSGEAELEETIASGRVRVCIDPRNRSAMSPVTLERLTAYRLALEDMASPGMLYRP